MDERCLKSKIKKEMSLLEIKNLNISYKTRKETIVASSNVNFTLERGEILGIVGESGSGKSTIANAIINLVDPPGQITSGTIKIDNKELQNNEEIIQHIRGKKIGFVFQDPQTSLNPLFKIKEQLIETIQTHLSLSYDEALKKSINLLEEVGIENATKRIEDYPHQFSGGMRQRVVIALAISCEPDLIIADEPTTALDVSIQYQILELLKELTKKRNLGVIIITHDMGVIAETTNKVIVMRHGLIVEQGNTKDLLTQPKSTEARSLVISVPPTNKKIDRFKLIGPDGSEITSSSANLTKNIIKTWGVRKNTNKKLLDVKNITKIFDDQSITYRKKIDEKALKAVNDVCFELFEGETLGLVGESGSGKSTIAKIITGLVRPTLGELEYNSLSLYNSKRRYQIDKSRGQIQMIFQDPYSSLNPRFKVKDIIAEPIKFFQKSISRNDLEQNVNDLIDIVGMTRKSLERYPHEFSGGQRQRISIARALATRPRLLICDEPTSALDVSIQAQILNLLKDIQDELHLTMLFISHDLPVIRQMCNRIIVLKNGTICETNETEKLFNEPSHQYTKQLINLMPKIESLI
ncbi:MAG: ABC transporter ATP-binding protein [Pelagibacteraceae bacterium TMED201]|nr:MAG: ABC transporter ATP-binding protein [Pelagibacteraceae bacterium TMED201]